MDRERTELRLAEDLVVAEEDTEGVEDRGVAVERVVDADREEVLEAVGVEDG